MGDFRYAIRQFRRSPAFFATSVLLIAIGIGASTLMFSLVNSLLLRPLPVRDPQSLVELFETRPNLPPQSLIRHKVFLELAAHSTTLTNLTGQLELTTLLEHGDFPERIYVQAVTHNFFTSLGIKSVHGRLLEEGDRHTAVLSYACWQRTFHADAAAIGSTVRLGGHPFTIVGVTPPEFNGTTVEIGPDIRVPYDDLQDFFVNPRAVADNSYLDIVARLRPGVSLMQAQQETAAIWERTHPDPSNTRNPNLQDVHMELRSIEQGVSPLRNQFRIPLLVLLGGTTLLLLIVCSNVGGLLLARATAREKETAIRLAMGASRFRIVRQWLAESLLLTVAGGFLGISLAYALAPSLLRWIPAVQSRGELRQLSLQLHPDFRVFAFCLAACGLTAALAAFAPSWRAARGDLQAALKTAIGDARQRRFQFVLSAAQIALCTVLLVGAGLVSRSLFNLRAVDAGFDRDHILTFTVDPLMNHYDSAQTLAFQNRLLAQLKVLPGVRAVGMSVAPLMVGVGMKTTMSLPGRKAASKDQMNTSLNAIDRGYFEAMGIRLVAGEGFGPGDADAGKPAPVVVNEAFVRHFYPGQIPVGQLLGAEGQYRVIGVVTDTNYRSLRETPPPIFYLFGFGTKAYPDTFTVHIRTQENPRDLILPALKIVRSLDPKLAVHQAKTISSEVERSLWQERLTAGLVSSFGMFAMLLSAIGLYGSLSYFVSGRKREIGVRMAVGASRSNIVWLVMRQILAVLLIGLAVGLAFSFLMGRAIESVLFQVHPLDPLSLAAAMSFVALAGALAAASPTYRVLRLNPSVALRDE